MNIVDMILIAAIAAAVIAAVVHIVRSRKKGGCGCGCEGCPSKGSCGSTHRGDRQ